MYRKRFMSATSKACLARVAFPFLLACASAASSQATELRRPVAANGLQCSYLNLNFGPVIEVTVADNVILTADHSTLISEEDGKLRRYDLQHNMIATKLKAAFATTSKRAAAADLRGSADFFSSTLKDYKAASDDRKLAIEDRQERLRNGRTLSVSRLFYGNGYLLKVGADDDGAYQALEKDLLKGSFCGQAFASLSSNQKAAARPLVQFYLWDAMVSGKLDDFEAWLKYQDMVKTFVPKDELAKLLETYAYRLTEFHKNDPLFGQMDPDKFWSFSWNAVAELFHDKEFVHFTDLSTYQRNGTIGFALLGSQKIEGVERNRFGFWAKPLTTIPTSAIQTETKLAWTWQQGSSEYSANVVLSPPQDRMDARFTRFPAEAHNGILVLDATFLKKDVLDLIRDYKAYLRSEGFSFDEERRIADVRTYLQERFTVGPDVHYLIREGHSDGDDDNLMAVNNKGFLLDAHRTAAGVTENVSIIFDRAKEPKYQRIPNAVFADWVETQHKRIQRPLVYFNTSCWGLEKAWMNLANIGSSRIMEIAARTSVNYFTGNKFDATGLLMESIRTAADFGTVRDRLKKLASYSSGIEDWFILPDESDYPQSAPIVNMKRSLFVRRNGAPAVPYTPDGYF